MENNKEKTPLSNDNGALWAIVMTIGMVVVMAVLKHFIG